MAWAVETALSVLERALLAETVARLVKVESPAGKGLLSLTWKVKVAEPSPAMVPTSKMTWLFTASKLAVPWDCVVLPAMKLVLAGMGSLTRTLLALPEPVLVTRSE